MSRLRTFGAAAAVLYSSVTIADGIVVDKIYDPYVQPLETEVEWRAIIQSDDELSDAQKHSLGVGRGLSDSWAIELYALGIKTEGEGISLSAYEIEAKWQMTEQGEYAADWGMVFEFERENEAEIWEASATLVTSRDFGRWTGTVNLGLIYEWGDGVDSEFETALRAQMRYRLQEAFEPAIELHMGQDTIALGPAVTGVVRLSPGKKLHWEAGIFRGLDKRSPDQTVKLNVELEF